MLYRSVATFFVAVLATGAVAVPVTPGSDSTGAVVARQTWDDCWNSGFEAGYREAIANNCPGHPDKREEVGAISARGAAAYATKPSIDKRNVCDDARMNGHGVGWNAGFDKCFT